MTKYEIMAMAMGTENQFEADGVGVAARIAAWLEATEWKLRDEEVADLIRLTGAVYRLGVNEGRQGVVVEDLFPVQENWSDSSVPTPGEVPPGHSQR
ncbi:hypothetical protein E4K72_01335 [Oxalobacteraceae bacterium OM1]|nr:hypothetical protein E4K72_01335 [Oxalobacteraceae bacterium OM1]